MGDVRCYVSGGISRKRKVKAKRMIEFRSKAVSGSKNTCTCVEFKACNSSYRRIYRCSMYIMNRGGNGRNAGGLRWGLTRVRFGVGPAPVPAPSDPCQESCA